MRSQAVISVTLLDPTLWSHHLHWRLLRVPAPRKVLSFLKSRYELERTSSSSFLHFFCLLWANWTILCLYVFFYPPTYYSKKKHSHFASPFFRLLPRALSSEHTLSQKNFFPLSRRFISPYPWEMETKHLHLSVEPALALLCFHFPSVVGRMRPNVGHSGLQVVLWHSVLQHPMQGLWTSSASMPFSCSRAYLTHGALPTGFEDAATSLQRCWDARSASKWHGERPVNQEPEFYFMPRYLQ